MGRPDFSGGSPATAMISATWSGSMRHRRPARGASPRTVQFSDAHGRRPKIGLGKVTKAAAVAIRTRIEYLAAAKAAAQPIDLETSRWMASIGDDLLNKLAAIGLAHARQNGLLAPFLDDLIGKKTGLKPGTIVGMKQTRERLTRHFGESRPLRDITPAAADDFAAWLRTVYAQATASRTIKRAKEYFRRAVRAKMIDANPFEDVPAGTMANPARQAFISHADTLKVIDAAPSAEWRAVIALARFGGLRIPSEILPLTWGDFLWDQNRFRVTSPKTARHAGKGERWVPIFSELKPYLDDLFEQAAPGQVSVFTSFRAGENLHTVFTRLIRKAGLMPWERPFQNLRSSRETELMDSFPSHLVTTWIGNSRIIAEKHYLQVRDSDFDRAAGLGAQKGGANSGAFAVQNRERTGMDIVGLNETGETETVPAGHVGPLRSTSDHSRPKGIIVPE